MKKILGLSVALGLALVLVRAPAETQIIYGQELPADADLDAISSLLAINMGAQGAAAGGPIAYAQAQACREFDQSRLWIHRLDADAATMAMIMTTTFLQLQRQIHSAVGAADYIVNKLKEDIAWFEDRNGNFRNPGYAPPTQAERDDLARYNEIKRRLAFIQAPAGSQPGAIGLPEAASKVINTFDAIRARNLSGGKQIRARSIQDSREMAYALVEFGKAAKAAEDLATSFMTIGNNKQGVASPRQQIRLDLNNLSENLVFFVRIWTPDKMAGVEKEPPVTEGATAYYLRKDCEQWIILWPTSSTYPQGAGTVSGKDPVNAQLPSMLWLPAKLKDRLELRVATYGEFRRRVRWDNLFGRQVRPDMSSLSRGFYYMSYSVNEGEKDQILSRWFSMKDDYNWDFRRGVWTDGLGRTMRSSTPEERKQFRSMRTENWKMTNDRLIWLIPSGVGSILADPNMSVIVSGDAEIVHATGKNPMGEPHPEKGSGELNINLSVW